MWRQGIFVPDGHTVSISDICFVAHQLQVVGSRAGIAVDIDARIVKVDSGPSLDSDVLIKCIGFEINEGVERMVGISHLRAGWIVDSGCYAVFEPHPDGGGAPGFGSYLDSMNFRCKLLAHHWATPTVPEALLKHFQTPVARMSVLRGSENGAGLMHLIAFDAERVLRMMREHVDEVLTNCMSVWTPEQFVEHNEIRWIELHDELRSTAQSSVSMPFIFAEVLEVVRSEAPHLFSADAAAAAAPLPSESSRAQASAAVLVRRDLPDSELARTLVAVPDAE